MGTKVYLLNSEYIKERMQRYRDRLGYSQKADRLKILAIFMQQITGWGGEVILKCRHNHLKCSSWPAGILTHQFFI